MITDTEEKKSDQKKNNLIFVLCVPLAFHNESNNIFLVEDPNGFLWCMVMNQASNLSN